VINQDTIDNRKYELVEVSIPDLTQDDGVRVGTYLRMINPSTGEIHFEGVPNVATDNRTWNRLKEGTVNCALTWRDNDKTNKYIKRRY